MVKKRQYGQKKSKPAGAERSRRQNAKDRYAHAREDAQLLGLIPTTPEEALKPEKVDPSSQSEQTFPGLIGAAMRKGWAVPEEKKPQLVDELISVLEDPEAPQSAKVLAFNALTRGDQIQFERDNPEPVARARGQVKIENKNEVTVVNLEELFRKVDEQRRQEIASDGSTLQSDLPT